MAFTNAPSEDDLVDMDAARARLADPAPQRGSVWAMLGASAFAAVSGLALCAAVFVGASDLPSARPAPAPGAALLAGGLHAG